MFIAKHTIKLCLTHWKRFLCLLGLTALLCIATGLLGSFWLQNNAVVDPITLLIADEDDSFESRLFFDALTAVDLYDGLLVFEKDTAERAKIRLEAGEAVAVAVIPEGFAESVKTGVNMPVTVWYSRATPLKSQLVKLYGDAFTDMLKTSQIGVYTALEYARAYGTAEQYQTMFMQSNMTFLTKVAARQDLFRTQEVSATGQVGIFAYYLLHGLVFLLLISPLLLLDVLRPMLSGQVLGALRRMGNGPGRVCAGTAGGLSAVYLGIGVLLAAAAWLGQGRLPDLTLRWAVFLPALTLVLVLAAMVAVLTAVLVRSTLGGGLFLSGFSLMGLLLSGGVVPAGFLAPWVQFLGKLTPHYWAVQLLACGVSGDWSLTAVLAVAGFSLLCLLLCRQLLANTARWEGAR